VRAAQTAPTRRVRQQAAGDTRKRRRAAARSSAHAQAGARQMMRQAECSRGNPIRMRASQACRVATAAGGVLAPSIQRAARGMLRERKRRRAKTRCLCARGARCCCNSMSNRGRRKMMQGNRKYLRTHDLRERRGYGTTRSTVRRHAAALSYARMMPALIASRRAYRVYSKP